MPPRLQGLEGDANGAARASGFSLHAGVGIAASEREKLERLCRYVTSIEQPEVIARTLAHLERTAPQQYRPELPLGARAPPVPSRLL